MLTPTMTQRYSYIDKTSFLFHKNMHKTFPAFNKHNHFMALLDFVWDYPGEPAPSAKSANLSDLLASSKKEGINKLINK